MQIVRLDLRCPLFVNTNNLIKSCFPKGIQLIYLVYLDVSDFGDLFQQ